MTLPHPRSASPSLDPFNHPPVVLDPEMQTIFDILTRLGNSCLPVLLLGETGSGKEVIADFAHRSSGLADQKLLKINCAGLTESMVESELFGHERGAFTGATQQHQGVFEAAHGGTLFLDEVAELSLRTQAKLLRVLETGEFSRLGSCQTRKVKVRWIAATHRRLPELVEQGEFRRDLYFRLNGATIEIPPLRRRPSEILPLAQLFLKRSAELLGRPQLRLGDAAIAALASYAWPGNIRELRNAVECAAALCVGDVIQPEAFALGRPLHALRPAPSEEKPVAAAPQPVSLERGAMRSELKAFERAQILAALADTAGNQTRAAELLGVSRRTLTNKLNAFGLERPRKALRDRAASETLPLTDALSPAE